MPNRFQDFMWNRLLGGDVAMIEKERSVPFGGEFEKRTVEPEPRRGAENYYNENGWFYIAVKRVADAISGLPWEVHRKRMVDGEMTTDLENGPAQAPFDMPNDYQPALWFKKQLASWIKIRGEAFVLLEWLDGGMADPETQPPSSIPRSMHIIPAPIARPVADKRNRISRYEVQYDGRWQPVHVDRMIHIPEFNAKYDLSGLGAGEALDPILQQENFQTWYNTQGFKRGGSHQRAVIESDQPVPPPLRVKLLREFMRKFTGRNAWEAVMLDRGFKVKPFGSTHRDMEFSQMHKANREMILGACGVTPAQAGVLEDANYSNMVEQDRIFWKSEVTPNTLSIEAGFTFLFLRRFFGDDYLLKHDFSGVDVLQENLTQEIDDGVKMINSRIASPNMVIRRLKKKGITELEEYDGGDLILAPSVLFPVSDLIDVDDDDFPTDPVPPPPTEDPEDEDENSVERALIEAYDHQHEARCFKVKRDGGVLTKQDRDELRAVNIRDQERFARTFRGRWRVVLREWERSIVSSLESQKMASDSDRIQKVHTVDDVLVETSEAAREAAIDKAARFIKRLLKVRGDKVLSLVGLSDKLDVDLPHVAAFIEEMPVVFSGRVIPGATDRLRKELTAHAGQPISELQTVVRNVMKFERARALSVARTLATPGFNFASEAAYIQSDVVPSRSWLTAGDGNVRQSHAAAEGQSQLLGTAFTVGGEELQFPGDPSGSPGNIIACRCTTEPDIDLDKLARHVMAKAEANGAD